MISIRNIIAISGPVTAAGGKRGAHGVGQTVMRTSRTSVITGLAAVVILAENLAADEIRVAVASNFADAARAIADRFEADSGDDVTLIVGSTGKLYAQIMHGAPVDAFFAADARRPERLEAEGAAVPGGRFTYAVGKLVLWSPIDGYVDPGGDILRSGDYRYLAMANPDLAPYGSAAREVLQARGLLKDLNRRIVRGENVVQAYHYIRSGNAELGFVAYSQLIRSGRPIEGSWWQVPQNLYSPIEQQAVLVRDVEAARAFLSFARSAEAREIIRAFGYGTPSE